MVTRQLPWMDQDIHRWRLIQASREFIASLRQFERPPANLNLAEGVPTRIDAQQSHSGAGSPAYLCASE